MNLSILSISNCPLDESQGSGYVIVGFCEGLRARGHGVDLFGPLDYEPLRMLKGRAKSYRQALGMLWLVLRRVQIKKYDVVELWGGESWLAASFLYHLSGRPLTVSHSNGIEPHCSEALTRLGDNEGAALGRKWYRLDQSSLMRNAFTRVDGMITVSEFDANYAARCGYQPPDRIRVIENSLPEEFIGQSFSSFRPPVVGYCGSWIDRKGVKNLGIALNRVLVEGGQRRLLLIGVGHEPDLTCFSSEVRSRIEVIPFLDNKAALRECYSRMSLLVLPSYYESFGLVAAEAMSSGCALVATMTGFAASLLHREQAYILESNSAQDIYAGIIDVLSDESLRRCIARGGYERVQVLKWKSAIDIVESTLRNWLSRRRSPN